MRGTVGCNSMGKGDLMTRLTPACKQTSQRGREGVGARSRSLIVLIEGCKGETKGWKDQWR